MSRAFVKDLDDSVEELPERAVSLAPNLVTPEGLAAIEAEIEHLHQELAQVGEDRAARARIGRDLRYWTARHATAQIAPPPEDCAVVRFGCTVTIDRDDGRRQSYRIVGEDEADPERGTLSHASPLARAALGKAAGDSVRVAGGEATIAAIS